MKKYLSLLSITMALAISSSAQKTDPSPYCNADYDNNYNMISSISVGAYTHSFGAMGSTSTTNTYVYVDTAHIPPISSTLNTSMLVDFYSTPDVEPAYFGVWIDYNQNNMFDADEMIMHNQQLLKDKLPSGAASSVALSLTFKAPSVAKMGKTRMRIVRSQKISDPTGAYDSTYRVQPCYTKGSGTNVYGCAYDFDVTIYSIGNVDENILRQQISISPNPATTFININNSSTHKILKTEVYDMSGKKCLSDATGLQKISLNSFAPGLYAAYLYLENGYRLALKFSKL